MKKRLTIRRRHQPDADAQVRALLALLRANQMPSGGDQTAIKKPAAATAGGRIKNSPAKDSNDAGKS